MKKNASILILLVSLILLGGASVWDGTASCGQASRFDRTGRLGLSSVFPEGSFVDATDLGNGKTVHIQIIRATTGPDGVFLVLSPEAAMVLGLNPGDNARVSVSLADPESDTPGSPFPSESFGTSDSDVTLSLLAQHEQDLRRTAGRRMLMFPSLVP